MDFKKTSAASSTITRNLNELDTDIGNLYKALTIISKRSNQIGKEMKEELNKKLEEFASYTDNLEEVFENREQIEISKFYERLPKPTLIAIQEFEDENIYHRTPDQNDE